MFPLIRAGHQRQSFLTTYAIYPCFKQRQRFCLRYISLQFLWTLKRCPLEVEHGHIGFQNCRYPVLQSSPEEPEYYLPRDYRGNYDINGSLFLQADCILGESKNLTIYGHNMNSGAMFGNLDRYASYDYWKAHPRVFFQTPEGMEEYRIAAVLKADVSMFDFQQTSFHSPQELEAYAAQAKALSLFETGVAGAGCETTLTLVTCSYEWKEARNILVAVKAEPER